MTKQQKSALFVQQFEELFGVRLFAKANHNLIAMNSGGNSPYKMPPNLIGCSVGVKFTAEETFLEFHIRDSHIDECNFIKAFNEQVNFLKQKKVAISEAKTEGTFNLYLIPTSQFSLDQACKILHEMCDVMKSHSKW